MPALGPGVDQNGLLASSVACTDRSLNQIPKRLDHVMCDVGAMRKTVDGAYSVAFYLVLGSGSFGMASVARQFANGQHAMVIRNGYFSFRLTQILNRGHTAKSHSVLKARPSSTDCQAPWSPPPIEEVVASIAVVKAGWCWRRRLKQPQAWRGLMTTYNLFTTLCAQQVACLCWTA
jgi:aspartate aminotransferase-like enzyme